MLHFASIVTFCGVTLVCDKRDKAISNVFCRDLHLTSMFSGLLQKDLFKGK